MEREDVEELMETSCTMGIIFAGKLRDLYKTTQFLRTIGCHVYYKKTSRDRLTIVISKENGEKHETN